MPSGDHAGSVSSAWSFVRLTGTAPMRITQMSPTAANATCVPSGEITGRTMPFTGRGDVEVKSRGRRAYVPSARVTCRVAVKGTVAGTASPSVRRRMRPSDT